MKKFVLLLIVAVIAYSAYHKNAEKKRELLVGTWMMERDIPGGAARMHINLKPEGKFYVVVDASSGGRTAFGESSGNWVSSAAALKMTFTQNGIPGVDLSKFYGGRILTLDEKTLTYQSQDGVETWKRAH